MEKLIFRIEIERAELNRMKENAECPDMNNAEFICSLIANSIDSHGRPIQFDVLVKFEAVLMGR